MSLSSEIQSARKKIAREGLDMSIGEIASLYERRELYISPPYQRLFRWKDEQKTRFIESVFLNVPLPSIFVYTREDGRWELVDGLQRISTCLQFMGKLGEQSELEEFFVCGGTNLVPSLDGARWPASDEGDEIAGELPLDLQLNFKRARMRVEILGPDTDADVRFELFQRLNSGGSPLSEQEVRSCIIYSVNTTVFDLIRQWAEDENFLSIVRPSERQVDEQYHLELIVRFLCLRHVDYDRRADVHAYLNRGILDLCRRTNFKWNKEEDTFKSTFKMIRTLIGDNAFRKARGGFSLGLYEFYGLAVSKLIDSGKKMSERAFKAKFQSVLQLPEFEKYTGSGVSGSERLRGFVTALGYDYFTK